MMGLREKSMLITENAIIGLAKAFGKTAARHADDIVKVMDDFISTSAAGGSVAAQRTMATRLKGLLDNLDSAVKVADEAGIKTAMRSILSDADFGASAATKIADDMFTDTADDAITAVLNKRASALKGRGLTDDAIKAQIKSDIDALLGEFPDTLKTAAKTKADNVINWGGKGATLAKELTTDDVFAKLGGNQTLQRFTSKFPGAIAEMTDVIDTLIAAGAKSADEVAATVISKAEKALKPSTISRLKALLIKYPTTSKVVGILIGVGILRAVAGASGFWNQIKLLGCDMIQGAADEDCQELRDLMDQMDEDLKEKNKERKEVKKDENKPAGNCDKTEADFKTWASTNVGTDNVTFNQTSCMGSVKDKDGNVIASFTWDGTSWK
jgi:hypothetical protein